MWGTEKGELIALLDLVKTYVVEAKLGYLALSYQTIALRSDIDMEHILNSAIWCIIRVFREKSDGPPGGLVRSGPLHRRQRSQWMLKPLAINFLNLPSRGERAGRF